MNQEFWTCGVAYPWHERDRAELREAIPNVQIPLARPGSELQRCAHCNVEVLVGPLLRATSLRVICALCAHNFGMPGF